MSKSELTSWESRVRRSIEPTSYCQTKEALKNVVSGVFTKEKDVNRAIILLLQFQLGAEIHWNTLENRNLIPTGLEFPQIIVDYYPGYSFLYDEGIHAIAINRIFLTKSVSLGPINCEAEYQNVYNRKPTILIPTMKYFLAGIEEVDHSVKYIRFGINFLPGDKRSEKRYFSTNHEYTALGWNIYYAKKYDMPQANVKRMEKILSKAIRYRREIGLRLKRQRD